MNTINFNDVQRIQVKKNCMDISVSKYDLFKIIAISLDMVSEVHRGKTLDKILQELYSLGGNDLVEEAKNYFCLKDKSVVAIRTVPISTPEEMGENGLFWKDLRK